MPVAGAETQAHPGAVGFLFAHQDDEFAISPRITLERASGREVFCAYLTNGGEAGIGQRCAESHRVLESLGVDNRNVRFIGTARGIPDGALYLRAAEAFEAASEWLRASGPLAALYVPAWEGGHHDHDVTHAIGVLLAARKIVPVSHVWQFPVYRAVGGIPQLFRVMSPLPQNGDVQSRRLTLTAGWRAFAQILSYPSQWRSFLGLGPGTAIKYVVLRRQHIQNTSADRLSERPHAGPLFYERRYGVSFTEVLDTVRSLSTKATGAEPG